mmetsp:Transcript_9034/g.17968  ORF Transcript_9034/g.17968 Transcript_9034/m.17968 type:complete len:92 (+) Transcript_9034:163-438(+)
MSSHLLNAITSTKSCNSYPLIYTQRIEVRRGITWYPVKIWATQTGCPVLAGVYLQQGDCRSVQTHHSAWCMYGNKLPSQMLSIPILFAITT